MMSFKVMTLIELKELEIGSIAHIKYWDERGKVRLDEVMTLTHKDEDEFCFNNDTPIPIYKIKTGDNTLLDKINNSGWEFTITHI